MGGWTNIAGLTKGSGIDPNAPLSSLLPPTPEDYTKTTTPGVSTRSKLQYLADLLGAAGSYTTGAGTKLLSSPLDYYQKLLQPPTREGLLEQTAPAVSSVIGQYSTGKKAVTQQPRGGGTAATMANLPFEESGAITGLLSQELANYINILQPAAAGGITGIAQGLADLGLSEMGLSSQDLSTIYQTQSNQQTQEHIATMQLIGTLLSAGMSAAAAGRKGG